MACTVAASRAREMPWYIDPKAEARRVVGPLVAKVEVMRQHIQSIVIAASLAAMQGCYTDAAYPEYADDGTGDLVEISPGVEVLADWNEPIFFADDFYWVFRGGFWFRSGWYGGGWARWDNVPPHVRGIAHPESYAHYRPEGVVRHEPVRGGYESHSQYHATHAAPASVHVRPAARSSGHHR